MMLLLIINPHIVISCRLQQRLIDLCLFGLTENAGRENDGPSKLQGMKLQDMKLQDMKMQDMSMTDQK